MEVFLIFCLSAAVLVLIIKISNLKKRVNDIEDRLAIKEREGDLPRAVIDREQISVPKTRVEPLTGTYDRTDESGRKVSADEHLVVTAVKQESSSGTGQPARKDETVETSAETPVWKQNANSLWLRVEKQFAENWSWDFLI